MLNQSYSKCKTVTLYDPETHVELMFHCLFLLHHFPTDNPQVKIQLW